MLPQLLSAAVEMDPHRDALVLGDRSLSYAELDRRSSQMARLLIRQGVGPEDVVAIAIPRSIESMLVLWAVAKSGAAFVPVDPTYPADRVRHMLSDSGARVGLTTGEFVDRLPQDCRWSVMDDSGFLAAVAAARDDKVAVTDRLAPLRVTNTAYIIYTSGSTGVPKGVVVTHAGFANLATEQQARYRTSATSRTLHFASPSFDASILELLMAVAAGSTMVIVPTGTFGGLELSELLRQQRVTHAFVTPAALASVEPTGLDELEVVVSGGENCPPELVDLWGRGRKFFNAYGPTETTVVSTISPQLAPGDPVTIGDAITGTAAYVLDGRLRPVPNGVAGELYLAGAGITRGYFGKPSLTSNRFVANPFSDVIARMYRTGDVVRRMSSGAMQFIGRNDFQVKVRGFRIELGEIDSALAAHPSVRFAVTIGRPVDAGDVALVSYVRLGPDEHTTVDELAVFAGKALPKHMIPSSIMIIDDVPLTPAGKLDRAALPEPVFATREYRAPETAAEIAVASVFQEILGVERVGRDDDFFELGGNSLSATRLAARIGTAFDVSFRARQVFEDPTVSGLATAVSGLDRGENEPLRPQRRPDRIPLSFAQQRMWFINRFDPESLAYNVPLAIRLSGALDVSALTAAIGDVIRRHEVLRTVYPEFDGSGFQMVLPPEEVTSQFRRERTDAGAVASRLTDFFARPFDVTEEVPLRLALFEVGDDATASNDAVLGLVGHHIAFDGFSLGPLTRDIMTAYAARSAGDNTGMPPLNVQYADFAIWQRAILGDENDPDSIVSKQIAYWKSKLIGIPELISLPTDRPRPVSASGAGEAHTFLVDGTVSTAIDGFARRRNTTPFVVLETALAVLLATTTGTNDIAVGTAVAGRGEKALDDVVGMFVNTLVLRNDIDERRTLVDTVDLVRDTTRDAFAHADIPFERLVEIVDPPRSTSHTPLFQVMLTLQNFEATEFSLAGLDISAVELSTTTAQFDLALTLAPDLRSNDGTMSGTFVYATDLFDESTVASFADRFVKVLRAIVETPSVTIRSLDLRSTDEKSALARWNDTARESVLGTVVDRFDSRVADSPHALAVVFRDTTKTYAQFASDVRALARYLVQAGVGPEVSVAVVGHRSYEMMQSIYAILAAGGAYVPIDPGWPAERIDYVLGVAAPVLVMTTSSAPVAKQNQAEPLSIEPQVVQVDTLDLSGFAGGPLLPAELVAPLRPDNSAYIIFTSGSTGRPKGVNVSHRAIVNQLDWLQAEFRVDAADRVLQKTTIGFDASVWELVLPLVTGAQLVLAEPDGHTDPHYLAEVIASQKISIAQFVPSVLALMVDTVRSNQFASVRAVLVGGEQFPGQVASDIRALGVADVHNVYGPTETAVQVAHHSSTDVDESVVPIGVAVTNVRLHVLDSGLVEAPVSVVGELYVAGIQLARGYASRPGQTAERFVADPFGAPGSRLYRTGDMVLRRADGSLVYVGRRDDQIKLNGLRIELGEIESALRADEAVSAAAATVVDNILVGFVVLHPERTFDDAAILATAAARLPRYMVPATLVVLEQLPRGSSGKIDRKALPAHHFSPTVTYREPTSDTETLLSSLFQEILGVEKVGVDDSFFALGGDSIMSIQLVSRAKSLGLSFKPRDVFESRTVARLAEVAVDSTPEDAQALVEIDGGGVGVMPTTPIVEAMIERGSQYSRFTQQAALELPAGIEREGILATISAVVDHHDMLRARLSPSGGQYGIEVSPAGSIDVDALVHRVELDATASSETASAAGSRALDAAVAELAPDRGVVLQFVWLDFGPTRRGRILVVAHHLVVDGVSWRILIPDFVTAWAQYSSGTPLALTPVGTSMRTWSHRLYAEANSDERADEIAYWSRVLEASDPLIGSRPFDSLQDRRSTMKSVSVSVPAAVTSGILTDVPRMIRGGVNDALLTGLAMAVAQWRRQRSVDSATTLILLEGHGREEGVVPGADLSRTVGWFTTVFPVALDLTNLDLADAFAAGPTAGAALKRVKEILASLPDKGIGYGLLRYLRPDPPAAMTRTTPQISFNYLGRYGSVEATEHLDIGWVPASDMADIHTDPDDLAAVALLDINAMVVGGPDGEQLNASFAHASGTVSAEDAESISALWVDALTALVRFSHDVESAGLTPSDAPLVSVSQSDIDVWEARYGALDDIWPLTPLQAGFQYHALAAGVDPDVYMPQVVLTLGGTLDVERLRNGANALIARHQSLRTVFVQDRDGHPAQLVLPRSGVQFDEFDLRAMSELERDARCAEIVEADRLRRFDLESGPFLRFAVIRMADGDYRLVVTDHHIVLDGWSMPIVLRELLALYALRGDDSVLPRPRPYRSFLSWLNSRDERLALEAWNAAFDGATQPTLLAGTVRTSVTGWASVLEASVSETVTAALVERAGRLDVTVNTLVQGAWALLLARTMGRDDVVFGATVSGRPGEIDGVENMVGLFINTVPVRIRVRVGDTVDDFLQRIQREQVELLEHQHVSLSEIRGAVGAAADFDTLTVFESYPVDESAIAQQSASIDGLRVLGMTFSESTHYPVALRITAGAQIHVRLEYMSDVVDNAAANHLVRSFTAMLESFSSPHGAEIDALISGLEPIDVRPWPAPTHPPTSGTTDEDSRAVSRVCAAVLDTDHISLDSSFFEIGGTSLGAMVLSKLLGEALGRPVPLRAVLEAPSVGALADPEFVAYFDR
ncbi:amino acid adenylation domain-containing protein [Rhodococcus fascians]|nr:amino acid adenylation domain-containing protein [Rhodococcus fascians]